MVWHGGVISHRGGLASCLPRPMWDCSIPVARPHRQREEALAITRMHDRSPRGVSNVGNGPLARHIIVSDGLKPNTLMLVAATEKVWPLEFLLASTCALMTSSHLPSTAARMRTRHATCPHESSGADAIVSEWNQHAFHLACVASGPITGVRKCHEGCGGERKRLCPKRANQAPLRPCWN